MDIRHFGDPPVLFRPISFWSLNGELSDDGLCRQIEEMKQAGWGGFFMHARGGMTTSYMTDEWLDRVETCVRKAGAEGMKAWIYDEYQWPSGTCRNTVAGMDPAFRETHLFYAYDRIPHEEADVVWRRAYRFERRQGNLHAIYGKDDPMPPRSLVPVAPGEEDDCPEGMRTLWIYVWRAPLSNPRFGGQSYVDLMNPDATRAFAAKTHEKYAARFRAEMGENGIIPGAFYDDITIQWDLYGAKGNAVPWTGRMPELFEKKFGYPLTEHLPELFFDLPGAEAVRADYIRLVTELFAGNFAGELARICEPWGLGICGHLMGNEGLYSDVMLHFYYQKYPTCDHLGRGTGDFRRMRRAKSVAEQFGKPATLCEAFAGGGHDMTLDDQRRQTDYLAHAGITTIVPHVTAYSMEGQRKYDHPPTFSSHAPFFAVNRPLADYQARLGYAMREGEQAADLLLIDPIESQYVLSAPGADPGYRRRGKIAEWLGETEKRLLSAHAEFAYGSEELMARFGRVEDGRLVLGERRYSTVLLPFCVTLRATTLTLLSDLLAQGGRVVAVGRLPQLCDGRPDGRCEAVLGRCEVVAPNALGQALADCCLRVETPDGVPEKAVRSALRRSGKGYTCFLYNTDAGAPKPLRLRLPYPARVTALDLYTGEEKAVPCRVAAGQTAVVAGLAAGGSLLLSILPDDGAVSVKMPSYRPVFSMEWTAPHPLSLAAPNLLLLDTFTVEEAGQPDTLRYACDIKRRGVSALSASFAIEEPQETGHYLLVENARGQLAVTLNGETLTACDSHPFDPCVAAYPLDGILRAGENTVRILCPGDIAVEYQPIYVAGPFTVRDTGLAAAGRMPMLRGGLPAAMQRDLTAEGLPFYCGNATLTHTLDGFAPRPGERYRLSLSGVAAMASVLRVNGHEVTTLFGQCGEADITKWLVPGHNTVEVTLIGSLRNALGPNRIAYESGIWFNIQTFTSAEDRTESYTLIPFGCGHICLVGEREEPRT